MYLYYVYACTCTCLYLLLCCCLLIIIISRTRNCWHIAQSLSHWNSLCVWQIIYGDTYLLYMNIILHTRQNWCIGIEIEFVVSYGFTPILDWDIKTVFNYFLRFINADYTICIFIMYDYLKVCLYSYPPYNNWLAKLTL